MAVTPRVDIAFKKLFGVEENKDLLISLINSIVSEEDQVSEVNLLNPYNPQNFEKDKMSILDIKARSLTGKYYNIEIQISNEGDYDKRALYYWAKLYTEQLRKGSGFGKLNKTIGIHILNFISIPSVEKYHNVFNLYEKESKIHHFKDIELHTIELCKFENNKTDKNLDEAGELRLLLSKVKTSLDRWLAFLTRHDLVNNKKFPKELKGPHLEKALKVLEVMNFNEGEKEAYEAHLKWLWIEESTLKKASTEGIEQARVEGRAEGLAEGIKKGEAKGLKKGIEKGRAQILENMLSQGIDIKIIAKAMGLTLNQIKTIKKKMDE